MTKLIIIGVIILVSGCTGYNIGRQEGDTFWQKLLKILEKPCI